MLYTCIDIIKYEKKIHLGQQCNIFINRLVERQT